MGGWLDALPSEVAYGLATALVLSIGGWVVARVRRRTDGGEAIHPQIQNVYGGTAIQGGAIALHVYPSLERRRTLEPYFPRAPLRLVNRKPELGALDRLLARAGTAPAPVVGVLSGTYAVGKTAVVRHWANANRARFRDGLLFADFSRRRHGKVVDVGDVLSDLLRDLGTADIAIPTKFSAKQRLFERMTAGKQLLVLLDDVEHAAQALGAMPSGSGSLVLVTSTWHLDELVGQGADPVPVDPLDQDRAEHVLDEILGRARIEAEPQAVRDLIELCAGLPIGLCVCAGRLATHPHRSVAWLVEQISADPYPLGALSESGGYAIEPVFDFAYTDLAPESATFYRRVGLHPGSDLTAPVAAAIADVDLDAATDMLSLLYDAHLIDQPAADRFRMHDVVLQHARRCAERDEVEREREAATRRMVDWYCAASRAADHAVVDDRLRLHEESDVTAPHLPEFTSTVDAFSWFDVERRNVMAALRAALDREWYERVWQFAEAMWPLCASHKRFSEWVESQEAGLVAGRRLGDPQVEARMSSQLARAHAELGDFARADAEMREAEKAAAACGNALLEASVKEFGGVCRLRAGDPIGAIHAFREAREMFEAGRSRRGVALQDYYTGSAFIAAGEHADALEPLESARETMADIGDEINVGRILVRRGEALRALGGGREARAVLEEALQVLQGVGIWFERAEAFEALAAIATDDRDEATARTHQQQAYRIYREFGHPRADELLALLGAESP